jgi:hypothetical protein
VKEKAKIISNGEIGNIGIEAKAKEMANQWRHRAKRIEMAKIGAGMASRQ